MRSVGDLQAVWDLESGEVQRTLEGHTAPLNSVAVTADGKSIVSASGDFGFSDNTVRCAGALRRRLLSWH